MMSFMSLMVVIPGLVFVSFLAASQIVLKQRIVDQRKALLVGMGGVPLSLAILTYIAYSLACPADPDLPSLSAIYGMAGGMIGGWVGASVAYITNQARSGKPELERAYQDTIAKAQCQPRRNTVNEWLKRYGLTDTQRNIQLYQLGSFVVLVSFVAVINRMVALGLLDVIHLSHLPVGLRLMGTIAPFFGPGLFWVAVRHRLPALGFGLRNGIIPLLLVYVPVYFVLNMLASPPAH